MPKYDFLDTLFCWGQAVAPTHCLTASLKFFKTSQLSPKIFDMPQDFMQFLDWFNEIETNQIFCFWISSGFEGIIPPEINRFICVDPVSGETIVFMYRPDNQTEESFLIDTFSLMQTIGFGFASLIERDIDMGDIVRNYSIFKGQVTEKETLVW